MQVQFNIQAVLFHQTFRIDMQYQTSSF